VLCCGSPESSTTMYVVGDSKNTCMAMAIEKIDEQ